MLVSSLGPTGPWMALIHSDVDSTCFASAALVPRSHPLARGFSIPELDATRVHPRRVNPPPREPGGWEWAERRLGVRRRRPWGEDRRRFKSSLK